MFSALDSVLVLVFVVLVIVAVLTVEVLKEVVVVTAVELVAGRVVLLDWGPKGMRGLSPDESWRERHFGVFVKWKLD